MRSVVQPLKRRCFLPLESNRSKSEARQLILKPRLSTRSHFLLKTLHVQLSPKIVSIFDTRNAKIVFPSLDLARFQEFDVKFVCFDR